MYSNLYSGYSDDESVTDLQIKYDIIREQLYDYIKLTAEQANFIDKLRANTVLNDNNDDKSLKVAFLLIFYLKQN